MQLGCNFFFMLNEQKFYFDEIRYSISRLDLIISFSVVICMLK